MDINELMVQIRKLLQFVLPSLSDEQKVEIPLIFDVWKEDKAYVVGDEVRYNDVLYRCLQVHTSQANWNPVDAASLWAKILVSEDGTPLEWEQPSSTNAYHLGDRVYYNGKLWECTGVDAGGNNVWAPGVYGWVEV